MSGSDHGAVERLEAALGAWDAYDPAPTIDRILMQANDLAEASRSTLSRIASLETALKERTAELKIATGALQADGRFAETVKVLTDVLDEYDSEEG